MLQWGRVAGAPARTWWWLSSLAKAADIYFLEKPQQTPLEFLIKVRPLKNALCLSNILGFIRLR